MVSSKSFNLTLIDGTATGRIKCTALGWRGLAFKLPRALIEASDSNEELCRRGIYFLFSVDDDRQPVVHVGTVDDKNVLHHLIEHLHAAPCFWSAVVLAMQDRSLGKIESGYIANQLINLARYAKRYRVHNATGLTLGKLSERDRVELDNFVDYARLAISVLGYKMFIQLASSKSSATTPLTPPAQSASTSRPTGPTLPQPSFKSISPVDSTSSNEASAVSTSHAEYLTPRRMSRQSSAPITRAPAQHISSVHRLLHLRRRASHDGNRLVEAYCMQEGDTFTVLRGSTISRYNAPYLNDRSVYDLRQALIDRGELVTKNNYSFDSASTAAVFVLGVSANGLVTWLDERGRTLSEAENDVPF